MKERVDLADLLGLHVSILPIYLAEIFAKSAEMIRPKNVRQNL